MNIIGLLDVPTTGTYHINGEAIENLSEDAQSLIRRNNI